MTLSNTIRKQALALGFDRVGLTPARRAEHADALGAWLQDGCHAGMGWMARDPETRVDPARLLAGAKSIVCVALAYGAESPPPEYWDDPLRGRVARFAWGPDYHELLAPRLEELARFIAADLGRPLAWKAAVDSAPLLERDHAARAGLGFIGQSTLLIAPHVGPLLLLGELLIDQDVDDYDAPLLAACCAEHRCRAACPTGALTGPYRLDARQCLSYLTIENKGAIPEELRPKQGRWIFGCDECLTACPPTIVSGPLSVVSCGQPSSDRGERPGQPRGRREILPQPTAGGRGFQRRASTPTTLAGLEAPPTGESATARLQGVLRFRPEIAAPRLDELLALDERGFRERFAGTPLLRARRRGLLRNAAVALGNSGCAGARAALERLAADPDELLREHALWALHRLSAP